MRDSQLNVYNLAQMRRLAPERFEFLRFDPNNNCNVQCVYCHNHRSRELVATEDFRAFLDQNALEIRNFQMGCIMEPTLDKRLADLMLLVSESRARPKEQFILQTNGTLLHMHDSGRMLAAGLNRLAVSIDAADPETHKLLRGGTSIAKVGANVARFHEECPGVRIAFVTTVTRANLPRMSELVRFGLDLGVSQFVFREVFYQPESEVVDHSRMPDLVLRAGEFDRMADELRSAYRTRAELSFAGEDRLSRDSERMKADSFR